MKACGSVSGVNMLIFWHHVMHAGFSPQTVFTYRQAQELGGHARVVVQDHDMGDLRPDFPPILGRIRRLISGLMRPGFPVPLALKIPAA